MRIALAVALFITSGLATADLTQRATDIAKKYPIVDGHVDVPDRIYERWADVTVATADGDFDYPRARAGGLDAPFISIYIPASKEGNGAKQMADILIDQVEALVARAPEKFSMATSVSEIVSNHQKGMMSLPMGIENGAPLEGNLKNLQHFYDRGVRYITLAHFKSNHIADSSGDPVALWNGLSPFGVDVVKEMNRLGIMVDISHVSDETFYQVLELSKVPVIASHSSLRHFTPGWKRNMSDDMVKALAKNDGVIMIAFGSIFLTEDAVKWNDAHTEAVLAFKSSKGEEVSADELAMFEENYRKQNPYPYASIDDVADHIDRAVQLAGIDHVGFGSDFDGVGDMLPEGLKSVAGYPNLIAELLQRNYSEQDIAKLMGGNVLRVMSEVEAFADKAKAGS